MKSSLDFGTAKFEPVLPTGVPANGKVMFRVVEPTAGAKKTAGMVWFAYPGRKGKVDVIFGWSGKKAEVKVVGDGTFTRQAQAVEDLDRGNEYRMLFKEGKAGAGDMLPPIDDPDAPPEQPAAEGKPNPPAKVTIVNESGSGMTFGSAKLEQQADLPVGAAEDPRRRPHRQLRGAERHARLAGHGGQRHLHLHGRRSRRSERTGRCPDGDFRVVGRDVGRQVRPGRRRFPGHGQRRDRRLPLRARRPEARVRAAGRSQGADAAQGRQERRRLGGVPAAALNHHINAGLEVDGDFGGQTLKAVRAFQRKFKKEGVLEDGIVGDQTWSYLREGAPAKPKTDGRKAHSYVEKGAEARWFKEKDWVVYDYGGDNLVMLAVSVGDVALVENRKVRFRVVNPAGVQKVLDRPVGPAIETTKDQRTHMIAIQQFATLFDEAHTGKAVGGDYQVTAYFPADLGGDTYSGVLNIMG